MNIRYPIYEGVYRILTVCYRVGIEDAYYFSRLFSQIMGMSPREYKKVKKG